MTKTKHGVEGGPSTMMWVAFIVVSSLGLSRAFACATPFAAVATVAVLTLPRRLALATVLLVWAGNQAIGFGLLHYPHTASTFSWGAAICIAALAALVVARLVDRWVERGGVSATILALCAAFIAYEVVILAATSILSSGLAAFAPTVVLRIFGINAVAGGLLLAVHWLAQVAESPSIWFAPFAAKSGRLRT